MKKLKKYLYPVFFSLGFLIFWTASCFIINLFVSALDYANLAWGILILFAWFFIAIPIYGIRYSKIILDEKRKILFVAYNSLLIVVGHILTFGHPTILIIITPWALFWNFIPLLWRSVTREERKKAAENEAQPEANQGE